MVLVRSQRSDPVRDPLIGGFCVQPRAMAHPGHIYLTHNPIRASMGKILWWYAVDDPLVYDRLLPSPVNSGLSMVLLILSGV